MQDATRRSLQVVSAILLAHATVVLGINHRALGDAHPLVFEDLEKEAALMKAREFFAQPADENASDAAPYDNMQFLDDPVAPVEAQPLMDKFMENLPLHKKSVEEMSDAELKKKATFEDEFGLPLKVGQGSFKPIRTMAHGATYGNHAASQRMYLKLISPKIVADLKDGDFVYDLCGADGLNTIDLVDSMRQKTSNFTMGFLDLPENDWAVARSTLRKVVSKVVPTSGVANASNAIVSGRCQHDCKFKPLGAGPSVILMAGSFFDQVAPIRSVNIAFSSTCVHYLSGGGHDTKPNIKAAQDWYQFLMNREKELVHGGTLHVTGLARSFKSPLWSYMASNGVLKDSLAKAIQLGLVPAATASKWRFPAYSRTAAEWTLPFDKNMIPSLALESFKIAQLPTPYWALSRGNVRTFADMYVPSVMAWMGPYIQGTLGDRFLNYFSQQLYADIYRNAGQYKNDYVEAVMTIRKY